MIEMLRADEIAKLLRISKQTWWRWWKSGDAPKPAIQTRGYTAWIRSDVEEYITRANKNFSQG